MKPNPLTPAKKAEIDNMPQIERARLWRYEPTGSAYFWGETGDYFEQVFFKAGGFTPEISKQIDRENGK